MNRLATCSLLACACALLTVASYGQGVIPITSVPITIGTPGKYVVQNNLVLLGGGTAIQVDTAVNTGPPGLITIDLNGFSLSTGVPNESVGINVTIGDGVSRVTIQNGAISDFNSCIQVRSGSGHLIRDLSVENFLNYGITTFRCRNSVIQNCNVVKGSLTRNSDGHGIGLYGGIGNRIVNDTVAGPDLNLSSGTLPFGILSVSGGNYFENDYIANCLVGIQMSSEDKYRAITTSKCKTPIEGGMDVDNASD
jgi:hypothetical protein